MSQPKDSVCTHSVTIAASIGKGRPITLSDQFITLTEVAFEAVYEHNRISNEARLFYDISAIWEVAGKKVYASAAFEIPRKLRSSRERSIIFGSHMQRAALRGQIPTAAGHPMMGAAEFKPFLRFVPSLFSRQGAFKFVVTLQSNDLPFGPVLSKLAISPAPTGLEFVRDALNKFSILGFNMQAIYEKPLYLYRVAGAPSFLPNARFEFITGKLEVSSSTQLNSTQYKSDLL